MYLDTDVLLALIKDEDWLKKHVKKKKLKNSITSSITIIEARIVLNREYSRTHAIESLKKIKKLKIKIIPLNGQVIDLSQQLLEKYSFLGIFDSIHVSTAIIKKNVLISTDTIYNKIEEVRNIDPRNL